VGKTVSSQQHCLKKKQASRPYHWRPAKPWCEELAHQQLNLEQ